MPPQFICSGFVQHGFAEALRRNDLPMSEVLFKEGLDKSDRAGILAVTPEDIATSGKLTWLYAIKAGRVHRVASYEAAKSIISGVKL